MLAVFEPLKRPQNGRTELDRPVGTEAELAAYQASLARTEADFAATWARIEALIKPEIDELLSSRPDSKAWQAPAQAHVAAADRGRHFSPSGRLSGKPAHRVVVKSFARATPGAEARELAPPEVKAALRPLEERLAAIAGRAQGTSPRLRLV